MRVHENWYPKQSQRSEWGLINVVSQCSGVGNIYTNIMLGCT